MMSRAMTLAPAARRRSTSRPCSSRGQGQRWRISDKEGSSMATTTAPGGGRGGAMTDMMS
jgi:hypothetical protein